MAPILSLIKKKIKRENDKRTTIDMLPTRICVIGFSRQLISSPFVAVLNAICLIVLFNREKSDVKYKRGANIEFLFYEHALGVRKQGGN